MAHAAPQAMNRRTVRVRLPERLAGARIVPPAAPLPPFRRLPPSVPVDVRTPPPVARDAFADERRADRMRVIAALDALRAAAADLNARHAAEMDELQQAAVHLASTIATQVFHQAVTAGDFPLERIARETAAQLADEDPIRVRLHPDDLALLAGRLDGEPLLLDADPKLVPDAALGRGTVAVDGPTKSLRADPVRTLETIRDDLLRNLGHART